MIESAGRMMDCMILLPVKNDMRLAISYRQIIVDAGDMISRISNEVIPATTHRVVNPEGENTARYSMPFFVHPYSTCLLETIPSCISEDNP